MSSVESSVSVIEIVEVLAEKQLAWLGRERVGLEWAAVPSGQRLQRWGCSSSPQESSVLNALSNLSIGSRECPAWALVETKYLITGPRTVDAWIKACGFLAELAGAETGLSDCEDIETFIFNKRPLKILFFPSPAFSGGRSAAFNFLKDLRERNDSIQINSFEPSYITHANISVAKKSGGFSTEDGWAELRWLDVEKDTNKRRTRHE